MSLILDALRKSEAERQRGQAPGLFVQQQPLRRQRSSAGAWSAGVLAGGLALALGWVGWTWLAAREGDGREAVATGDASPVPTASMPGGAPAAAAPGTAEVSAPGVTGSTAPAPRAAESPAATTGAVDEGARVADGIPPPTGLPPGPGPQPASGARAEPTASPATAPPGPAPALAAVSAAPAGSDLPGGAPIPGAGPGGDTGAPGTARPDPAAPASAAATADAGPDTTHLPRLADLSPAERGTLPPMKLSMHVYATEAAQRFVILDGRRLQEGGALAEGVFVQAITRDGLVLSVRGQPYWLGR